MVPTAFHNYINIAKVAGAMYTAFVKCQQIIVWQFDDSGNTVTFMVFFSKKKIGIFCWAVAERKEVAASNSDINLIFTIK